MQQSCKASETSFASFLSHFTLTFQKSIKEAIIMEIGIEEHCGEIVKRVIANLFTSL
jgi:hypothetical protein